MRKDTVLAPEWRLAPVQCPKCGADARAKFNPNNGALEAMRCTLCPWTENYVLVAKQRATRLNAMRRKNPRSIDRQQRLDTKGDPNHGA